MWTFTCTPGSADVAGFEAVPRGGGPAAVGCAIRPLRLPVAGRHAIAAAASGLAAAAAAIPLPEGRLVEAHMLVMVPLLAMPVVAAAAAAGFSPGGMPPQGAAAPRC